MFETGKRGGKPCVRSAHHGVGHPGWLGGGMTEEEQEQILDEHPDIEKERLPSV